MMAIRRFRRKLGHIHRKYLTRRDLRRWEKSSPRTMSYEKLVTHLLVVKNPKYAQIAKVSTFSFLHFHPASKVVIHVDEETKEAVTNWTMRSNFKNAITVKHIGKDDRETWQIQKTNLVLNLAGTSEIFIDADMRWNGPLDKKIDNESGILFFVEEYRLSDNEIFSKMLEDSYFGKYRDASMWNTSFVCFSGFELNDALRSEVMEIQEKILDYARTQISDKNMSVSTIRISEQLAISLAVSRWNIRVSAVKESDGYKDGSFLESSYFGATATHF